MPVEFLVAVVLGLALLLAARSWSTRHARRPDESIARFSQVLEALRPDEAPVRASTAAGAPLAGGEAPSGPVDRD
jgi:predicted negative regulator of RcsB-dependent stress response